MAPRQFLVVLAGFIIVNIIFLLLRHPLAFSAPSFSHSGVFSPGHTLSSWLLNEEARHAAVVRDRHQAIERLGEFNPFAHRDVTLWDFFLPAFRCPHLLERIGVIGDGGKWVCGLDRVAKQDKCVIYSFGVNGESSFEATLMKRAPGCEVWGYDYSVNGWGPEITDDHSIRDRAYFQPWALGGTDSHGENDHPKYWTLHSLMKHNGHKFIDILKIDTEGAEFDALTSFVKAYAHGDLPIGQLQVEIHAVGNRANFKYFLGWWESLEAMGLRAYSLEPNLIHITKPGCKKPEVVEYSLMSIRGNHALVSDSPS